MAPITITTLPGPNDHTIYMCPCGQQYPTATEAVLCQLTHGEETE